MDHAIMYRDWITAMTTGKKARTPYNSARRLLPLIPLACPSPIESTGPGPIHTLLLRLELYIQHEASTLASPALILSFLSKQTLWLTGTGTGVDVVFPIAHLLRARRLAELCARVTSFQRLKIPTNTVLGQLFA